MGCLIRLVLVIFFSAIFSLIIWFFAHLFGSNVGYFSICRVLIIIGIVVMALGALGEGLEQQS